MSKRIAPIALISFVIAAFGIVGVFAAGAAATAPAHRPIGEPPPDLAIEAVSFADSAGQQIMGWAVDSKVHDGAILLLHGIRADRRAMIGRARLLNAAGYSILMIDLQAHGESAGERITFGHLESDGVVAALTYARSRWPNERIAIIGSSLGGASAIFAARRQQADAYVLEAVYSTLREATENRLKIRLGEPGYLLASLLLMQTRLQIGVPYQALSPVDRIADIQSPVFIIAGAQDKRTTPENSMALFAQAAEPKSMWMVEGARHQDFLAFAKDKYQKQVLEFLNKYIRAGKRS